MFGYFDECRLCRNAEPVVGSFLVCSFLPRICVTKFQARLDMASFQKRLCST